VVSILLYVTSCWARFFLLATIDAPTVTVFTVLLLGRDSPCWWRTLNFPNAT
jgi:hypothetical protein